jgi:hypothetical protein
MIAATRSTTLLRRFLFRVAESWEEEIKSWQTELWEWHVARAFLQMHPGNFTSLFFQGSSTNLKSRQTT